MFEEFLKNTNVHDDSHPTLLIILSYADYRYMINYYFKPVFVISQFLQCLNLNELK